MREIKVKIIKENEDIFKFDIRQDIYRARISIKCSEEIAEHIKKGILFINENPQFIDLENKFVKEALRNEIYKFYNANSSQNNYETIDDIVNKISIILISLNKKKKKSLKKPAASFLKEVNNSNNNLIKILLLGPFGSGKSTFIKKLSNIDDEIDFPVVDTARTTIHNTHYIFKKYEDGNYKFFIDFKTNEKIYNLLSDSYYRSLDKIFNGIINGYDFQKIRDLAMEEFVNDPNQIFKIEYVLGKYYKSDNNKRNIDEKKPQVKFWDTEFEMIYNICNQYMIQNTINNDNDDNNNILKKNLYDNFIKNNLYIEKINNLIQNMINILNKKMKEICIKQEEKNLGQIIYDESKEHIIGFKCEDYNISKISDYIYPFCSTNIKYFTKILTPLVDMIVIEIPYNENLEGDLKNNKICITDTVGFEHRKTDDTNSLEGSTDYKFNNFDIIGVVDKATSSMSGTTENILRELYHNANKSKIMILYTFYDEFTKKDFEDDDDKKIFLKELQKTTIKKIDQSDLVNKFIDSLNSENRTIFLSGLCKNQGYNFNDCINKTLRNINNNFENLYDFKKLEVNNYKNDLIGYDYKKLLLVFNRIRDEYITQQKNIYIYNYPHYKITEALTKRLSKGETYFIGSSQNLKPVDDFCSTVMNCIDNFIKNPSYINFDEKDTIENHKYKVIDWFKEEISTKIKILAKKFFVQDRLKSWNTLYMYCGTGSDFKRRNGIIQEFQKILPELIDYSNNFADNWINEIESIFKDVLKNMKDEVENN